MVKLLIVVTSLFTGLAGGFLDGEYNTGEALQTPCQRYAGIENDVQ